MARSGCIYGPSGSRKTTQVKRFAHYIARKTGKATYLLSLDGGGWEPCDPEVRAGMIAPYRCEVINLPLVLLRKISQGYWPENPEETDPAKINLIPMDFNEFGGMAIEGWTSIGATVMRYLPDQGISVGGENRGKKESMQFVRNVQVMNQWTPETFGSNTQGDYNFVLRFLYGFTNNCNSLPFEYTLYTALEGKTTEDGEKSGAAIYGPAIEGKKGTAACGAWIGDLIHAQDYPVAKTVEVPDPNDPQKRITQESVDMLVRFYFRKHLEVGSLIPFPAKPRLTPERTPDLDKRFPGGYFEPGPEALKEFSPENLAAKGNSFDSYLEVLDMLSAVPIDTLKNWRAQVDSKLGRASAAEVAAKK